MFIRFASFIDKNVEDALKTIAQSYKIVSWNKFSIRVLVKDGGTSSRFLNNTVGEYDLPSDNLLARQVLRDEQEEIRREREEIRGRRNWPVGRSTRLYATIGSYVILSADIIPRK